MDEALKKTEAKPAVKTDAYTEQLFAKIKAENITVDPTIWSLLTHVLGNRAYAISLIVGDFLSIPRWILRAGSSVMRFLYRISGHKDKINNIDHILERAQVNVYQIKDFLTRLREATEKKGGFKQDVPI
ncbi:MAG: hypothetical protein NC923_05425 [Candidatus Omnitrophica bacterium]|nr:hypothetical protein [Candidatus Omnitrophota bacterium]